MADLISPLFAMWGWVAVAAFAIMTIFVALVYALGSMLMNEKMKTWAKMELLEVFYSALIFIVGVSSLPLIDGVVQGALGVSNTGGGSATSTWLRDPEAGIDTETLVDVCGSQLTADPRSVYADLGSCHIKLATYYLRDIFAEGRDFAYSVYRSYIWTSMAAEFSINIESAFEQAGFLTWTPWKGFFTMGNVIKDLCFSWAMRINELTKFQELMIRFIALALFPALFVAGCILRTTAFTRKLGGLLLAMAITLYFIYPAFYAFGGLVMIDMKESARVAWEDSPANKWHTHDPPVANTIYATGGIAMPGGNLTNDELETDLQRYEEMSDEEFAEELEKGEGFSLAFDLGADNSGMSEAEREAAFERSQAGIKSWFGGVSQLNMIDKFAGAVPAGPSYWSPNGHIDTLSRLTFFSVFFSFFGILATIAAIRSLSITFGGDIEIAGLTRLI